MHKFKRITKLLLVLLIGLMLSSCIYTKNDTDYVSNVNFEKLVIKTIAENENAQVTIMLNNEAKSVMQSGTIVKRELNSNLSYHYLIITSYDNLRNHVNNISVYIPFIGEQHEVTKYGFDEDLDLLVLSIEASNKIPVAKLEAAKDVSIGQSVVSITTSFSKATSKHSLYGMVSSIEDDFFYIDSKINNTDQGGGVYNLNKKLIGFISKTKFKNIDDTYTDGVSKVANIARYADYINNLTFDSLTININAQKENIASLYEGIDEFEETQVTVANDILKHLVKMERENDLEGSGIIVKKEDEGYLIVTSHTLYKTDENHTEPLKVKYNNQTYEVNEWYPIEEKGLALAYIKTNDDFAVAKIATSTPLPGQSVLGLGNIKDAYVTQGIVSKTDYEFLNETKGYGLMTDISYNTSMAGGGLFNLDGELISILLDKHEKVEILEGVGEETTVRELIVEGIIFTGNILNVAKAFDENTSIEDALEEDLYLNVTNIYEPKTEFETKGLQIVENNISKVVTVNAGSGHGSGTIFRKDVLEGGTNLYYVLTNNHVITGADEVRIHLQDGSEYEAVDLKSTPAYDIGVVRFETEDELDFIISKEMTEQEGYKYKKGQFVYAIGTPLTPAYNNYVTRGILAQTSYLHLPLTPSFLHDAALSPGNSGGALFGLNNSLMGVNTAKITQVVGGYERNDARGISISTNISTVGPIAAGYDSFDVLVRKKRLGITVMTVEAFKTLNPQIELPSNQEKGLVIIDIDKFRGAHEKLEIFDILIEIEGEEIVDTTTISKYLVDIEFGDSFDVKVLRKVDGQWEILEYTIYII